MNWPKNIIEERESPMQFLFEVMDPLVCLKLNLATWLKGGEDYGTLLFGVAILLTAFASSLLETVFTSDLFHRMTKGLLGMQSICKGAELSVACFGILEDWIMTQGHWREKKRQVDIYIEINLPHLDAQVASILSSPSRPCKYAIKGGMQISDETIKGFVPEIYVDFGGDIGDVMALSLLWTVFEGEMMVNGYTLSIIPPPLTLAIKEH